MKQYPFLLQGWKNTSREELHTKQHVSLFYTASDSKLFNATEQQNWLLFLLGVSTPFTYVDE